MHSSIGNRLASLVGYANFKTVRQVSGSFFERDRAFPLTSVHKVLDDLYHASGHSLLRSLMICCDASQLILHDWSLDQIFALQSDAQPSLPKTLQVGPCLDTVNDRAWISDAVGQVPDPESPSLPAQWDIPAMSISAFQLRLSFPPPCFFGVV